LAISKSPNIGVRQQRRGLCLISAPSWRRVFSAKNSLDKQRIQLYDFADPGKGENMSRPIRVLIVDPSDIETLTLIGTIKDSGYEPLYRQAATPEALRLHLEEEAWDVILCNYSLLAPDVLDVIGRHQKTVAPIPLIVISGIDGEEAAVKAMRAGAGDYIVKTNLSRLVPALERELQAAKTRPARPYFDADMDRLRKGLEATIQAISTAVEVRDPYTAGHQRRVSHLACAMAKEMGLPADRIDGLHLASAIHDIGKLTIAPEILSKPAKLTEAEYNLIKKHPKSGFDILKDIDFPWPVARIVLEHHERVDGSGYPNGLTEENLLLESMILAVSDVVEAVASYRSYRPPQKKDLLDTRPPNGSFLKKEDHDSDTSSREQGYWHLCADIVGMPAPREIPNRNL
jgi:HD-GYP domain-containing protein (c-di-GMP phosphodiesterase class II)